MQQLEDAGLERALHGQQVPVYSYGKIIGTRTVYNDRLLMFYLRNRAASRFSADQRGQSSRQNTIGDPHYAAHISKLKKQWRKEWEDEQAAASRQSIYGLSYDRRTTLDRLIAAQAIARDATLITRNGKDFRKIEGLKLIEWETPED